MEGSATYMRCRLEVIDNPNILFAWDILEIMKKYYKGRLEVMLPKTIADMIYSLACHSTELCTEDDYQNDIIETVNDYINYG